MEHYLTVETSVVYGTWRNVGREVEGDKLSMRGNFLSATDRDSISQPSMGIQNPNGFECSAFICTHYFLSFIASIYNAVFILIIYYRFIHVKCLSVITLQANCLKKSWTTCGRRLPPHHSPTCSSSHLNVSQVSVGEPPNV